MLSPSEADMALVRGFALSIHTYAVAFQLELLYDQQIQEQRVGIETMAQIKSPASSSPGHGHREVMHLSMG